MIKRCFVKIVSVPLPRQIFSSFFGSAGLQMVIFIGNFIIQGDGKTVNVIAQQNFKILSRYRQGMSASRGV